MARASDTEETQDTWRMTARMADTQSQKLILLSSGAIRFRRWRACRAGRAHQLLQRRNGCVFAADILGTREIERQCKDEHHARADSEFNDGLRHRSLTAAGAARRQRQAR